MPQSVIQQLNAAGFSRQQSKALAALLEQVRQDIESTRLQLNAHVHSGVTAGGANTAAPTTTLGTDGTALGAVQNLGLRK